MPLVTRDAMRRLLEMGFRRHSRNDDGTQERIWSDGPRGAWLAIDDAGDKYARVHIYVHAWHAWEGDHASGVDRSFASLGDALDCLPRLQALCDEVHAVDPAKERCRAGLDLPFPKRTFALSEIGGDK